MLVYLPLAGIKRREHLHFIAIRPDQDINSWGLAITDSIYRAFWKDDTLYNHTHGILKDEFSQQTTSGEKLIFAETVSILLLLPKIQAFFLF